MGFWDGDEPKFYPLVTSNDVYVTSSMCYAQGLINALRKELRAAFPYYASTDPWPTYSCSIPLYDGDSSIGLGRLLSFGGPGTPQETPYLDIYIFQESTKPSSGAAILRIYALGDRDDSDADEFSYRTSWVISNSNSSLLKTFGYIYM